MIIQLKEYILDTWKNMDIELTKPNDLAFLKIAENNDRDAKLTILIFAKSNKKPILVAKICRNPDYEHTLQREFDILSSVYHSTYSALAGTIPTPLFYQNIMGYRVFLMTALDGKPLQKYLGSVKFFGVKRSAVTTFRLIGLWLTNFHKATAISNIVFDDNALKEHVILPIEKFVASYDFTKEEEKVIMEISERGNKFLGMKLPIVPEHGAFWPGNILVTKHKIGVIDWESCRMPSLPFYDLFNIIATYGPSNKPIENFRKIFDERWFSKLVRDFISLYCQEMGIEVQFAWLFFPISLMVKSLRDMERYGYHTSMDYFYRRGYQIYSECR